MNGRRRPRVSSFPDFRLHRGDARYPEALLDLQDDAPASLWMRGSPDLLDAHPRVAIVGTRRATAYGLRVTRELTDAFVRAGACIVSGMATGIDGMAHRRTLELGGATIAVLGTGLDVAFPAGHRLLQRSIADHGLLITELDHPDRGRKFTFPHRNRIIAALSSLVIVVEAPIRSGALNTAERAMLLNRQVAAVPGPIDQPQSAGANWLIAQSAHILASIEDALALVQLTPPPRVPRLEPGGDEGRIWAALAGGVADMDTLCHRSGLPAAHCMAAVTRLELAGAIECAMTGEIRRR